MTKQFVRAKMDRTELELVLCIVERSPAIVFRWIIQDDWPVAYVSKNIEQLGYTREDMLTGKVSWPGITHPDDVARLEEEVQGHLAQGVDDWSQFYRIRAACGEYRWIRDWNLLLRDDQGTPKAVQGIIIDVTKEVTETQQREEAQRQLEVAMAKVISEFIPICSMCKAIRDEDGRWSSIESHLSQKHSVKLTHGYCPDCAKLAFDELENS